MISITDIKFTNEFTSTPSSVLRGGVGDFVSVEINLKVAWKTSGTTLIFNSENKTITRSDCGQFNGSFFADGFKEGDSIYISGGANTGVKTIYAINDSTIVTIETLTSEIAENTTIYGVTVFNEFEFLYKFSKTNETTAPSYKSYTDGSSLQKFSCTWQDMINGYYYNYEDYAAQMQPNNGNQSWFIDFVNGEDCRPTIEYLGVNENFETEYKVIFKTLITPIFEVGQTFNLQQAFQQSDGNNNAAFTLPTYFQNGTLAFIFQLNLKRDVGSVVSDFTTSIFEYSKPENPNDRFSGIPKPQKLSNAVGEIVWFNQFYKNGIGEIKTAPFRYHSAEYSVNSEPREVIDVNAENEFEFLIKKLSNLTTLNAKVVLNFCWLPKNKGVFTGYSDVMNIVYRDVLMYDRVLAIIGDENKSGDRFGTDYQVFKNDLKFENYTLYEQDYIRITGSIEFSNYLKELFNQLSFDCDYMIWCSIETENEIENQIHSPILIDVDTMFIDVSKPDVLTVSGDGNFKFYTTDDLSGASANAVNLTGGEYGVINAGFKVAKGSLIDEINFSFVNKIQTVYGIELEENILQKISYDLKAFNNGVFTDVSINESRGYNLEATDKRNLISIERDEVNDTSTEYAYKLNFGFQATNKYFEFAEQQSQISKAPFNDFSIYSTGKFNGEDILAQGTETSLSLNIGINVFTPNENETALSTSGVITPFQFKVGVNVNNQTGITNFANATQRTFDILFNDLNLQPLINEDFICATTFYFSTIQSATSLDFTFNAQYLLDGVLSNSLYSSNNIGSLNTIIKNSWWQKGEDEKSFTVFAVCNFNELQTVFDKVTNFSFTSSISNLI